MKVEKKLNMENKEKAVAVSEKMIGMAIAFVLCNSSAGHVFLDRCGGNGAYFLKHNSGEIRVSKIRSQNRRRKWLDFAEKIF